MPELVAGQETLEQSLLGPVAFAALFVPPLIDAQGRELDVAAIRSQLKRDCDALVGGDLSKQQAMLAAQAAVLNTLFMTALGHARGLLLSEPETGDRRAAGADRAACSGPGRARRRGRGAADTARAVAGAADQPG
jgi:hypothetical protein